MTAVRARWRTAQLLLGERCDDADLVEIDGATVASVAEQLGINYSSTWRQIVELEHEGVIVARSGKRWTLDPNQLTALLASRPVLSTNATRRPKLILVDDNYTTSGPPAHTEVTDHDRPEVLATLERLAAKAIEAGDHRCLDLILDRITRATTNHDQREIAHVWRDFAPTESASSLGAESRASLNSSTELELKTLPFDSSNAPTPARIDARPEQTWGEPPPMSSPALTEAVQKFLVRHPKNEQAKATPSWQRSHSLVGWRDDERAEFEAKYHQYFGSPPGDIADITAELWPFDMAQQAIDAITADKSIRRPTGAFRTHTILGYHQSYPPTSSALDAERSRERAVWLRASKDPPLSVAAAAERIAQLSGIGRDNHFHLRVAGACAGIDANSIAEAIDRSGITADATQVQHALTYAHTEFGVQP